MKINTHYLIEFFLVLTLIGLSIALFSKKEPSIPVPDHMVHDTVYVNKPYKPVPEYKFISVPKLVMFYKRDTVHVVDSVLANTKTVVVYYRDSSKTFSTGFLSQFPNAPKIIQLRTDKKNLSITKVNTNGDISTETHEFCPDIYNYNYYLGTLTYKKKSFLQRLQPTAELMVRPVHNLWDLNLGIGYKTRKTNYEIGLNTHYYPIYPNNQFGLDPYFKIRLTF